MLFVERACLYFCRHFFCTLLYRAVHLVMRNGTFLHNIMHAFVLAQGNYYLIYIIGKKTKHIFTSNFSSLILRKLNLRRNFTRRVFT